MRTVRTTSGATAVQVVWSSRRSSRHVEHFGSAHEDAELAALKQAAAELIAAGQVQLDLGLDAAAGAGPLEIVGSKAGHLWDALCRVYGGTKVSLPGTAPTHAPRHLIAEVRD